MKDVRIEVTPTKCVFHFVSKKARGWGTENFNSPKEIRVDLWRAANIVNAIHADGMTTTPGVLMDIHRKRTAFLNGHHPEVDGKPDALAPCIAGVSGAPPSMDLAQEMHRLRTQVFRSLRFELRCVEVLIVVLISVTMINRIWFVTEPLLIEVGRWFTK
jgi:hypothetical protein